MSKSTERYSKAVAAAFKRLRIEKEMTVQEVADKLKISKSQVSDAEHEFKGSTELLAKFHELYGLIDDISYGFEFIAAQGSDRKIVRRAMYDVSANIAKDKNYGAEQAKKIFEHHGDIILMVHKPAAVQLLREGYCTRYEPEEEQWYACMYHTAMKSDKEWYRNESLYREI